MPKHRERRPPTNDSALEVTVAGVRSPGCVRSGFHQTREEREAGSRFVIRPIVSVLG